MLIHGTVLLLLKRQERRIYVVIRKKVKSFVCRVHCKTVRFFLRISQNWRSLRDFRARSLTRPTLVFLPSSPVSLFVLRLLPDFLFDCSRKLEYTNIRTVLQCICSAKAVHTFFSQLRYKTLSIRGSAPGIEPTTYRPFCGPTKLTLQTLTVKNCFICSKSSSFNCHQGIFMVYKERNLLSPC